MKTILLSFSLVIMYSFSWAQELASAMNFKEIVINQDEQTMKFNVCSTSEQVKHKKNVMYHWYDDNKMHKNRGQHSGHLMHGEVKKYNRSGDLVEQGQMKYGVKKGLWVKWHKNGEVAQLTKWDRGMKDGKELHFDTNGQLVLKKFYKNDREKIKHIIYKDGIKVKPEKVKKDRKDKSEKLEFEIIDEKKGKKKKRKEDAEKKQFFEWLKNKFKKEESTSVS